VTFITGHARCDNQAVLFADEKPLWVDGEFSPDVLSRIVVGNKEFARRPEANDGILVACAIRTNVEIRRHDAFPLLLVDIMIAAQFVDQVVKILRMRAADLLEPPVNLDGPAPIRLGLPDAPGFPPGLDLP
jgi:hypothetical protein